MCHESIVHDIRTSISRGGSQVIAFSVYFATVGSCGSVYSCNCYTGRL